ncbi:MAG: DNA replication/repair protein RecF [Gammaproteobacteria bacterium]|nr:DNA replication/repair protein RecF [Gammaproteobacteria bacterium]MDH3767063.1 DNA replication/repair protein RecF [Gammaproteobacteria bacterium]
MPGSLEKLQVNNFRCLEHVELEPSPGTNLIFGENASGKTSLLEAIFVLGRGRSFRTAHRQRLIRDGSTEYVILGDISAGATSRRIGIRASRKEQDIHIGGRPAASIAELGDCLPVEAIDPEVHKLVEEGPERRRRFLDWGTFHVDQSFLTVWQRYRKALRQRNALLQQQALSQLNAWDEELVLSGESLTAMRRRFLDALAGPVAELGMQLLDSEIKIGFRPGWNREIGLSEAIAGNRERDSAMGRTLAGPHRAELVIELDSARARARVSRGQQKLLAACLILAQLKVLATLGRPRAVLLLDDPGAELDDRRVGALLSALADLDVQLFVTALDRKNLPEIADRVFHMEQSVPRLMLQ